MSIEAMKQMVDALMVAVEYVEEGAEEFHRKFAGYKEHRHKAMDDDVKQVNDAITALRTAIEQMEKQEPVAWKYKVDPAFDGQKWHDRYDLTESKSLALWKDKDAQPLYTSPPASKPLTDEEIWDEVKAADLDWQTGWSLDEDAANRYITFARAIEAAHGITGEQK